MTALMNVLVVEDNDIDVERITRCLQKAELPNPLHVALDGEEALAQLRGTNGREPIDTPCLILLDLNMPRMNGLEFLAELRKEPDLADTPVLVLTTSDRAEDMEKSRDLGAVDYLTKPISRELLAKLVISYDAQQHGKVVDERTYTVVVVDADQAVLDQAYESALGTGWRVTTFQSPETSLDYVRLRAPDILIVGSRVGSKRGVELLTHFAALPGAKDTRMFISADDAATPDHANDARSVGASVISTSIMADSVVFRDFLEEQVS